MLEQELVIYFGVEQHSIKIYVAFLVVLFYHSKSRF